MALFHVFDIVDNRRTGVPMAGVQVRAKFDDTDTIAPIYADQAGAAFVPANYCVSDPDGMFSFYIDSGEYALEFLVGDAVIKTIPDFRPAEVGPSGPANSTYNATAELESADVANVSAILAETGKAGTFTTRNYVDFTAQVAADSGKVNYIRSAFDPTKVWVRTSILSDAASQTGASSGVTVDAELTAKATLTGVGRTATDLGAFTGSSIPDNLPIKGALQALETAVENTSGNAATKANASALGITATDANMGTTPGTILSDNGTAKGWLGELETATEQRKGYALDSRASLASSAIPAPIMVCPVSGYAVPGDGGASSYKRVVSEPSHPGKVQSADGAWWEITDNVLNVLQFGAKRDSTGVGIGTDAAAAFNSAIAACAALKRNLKIPSGGYRLSAPLVYTKSAVSGDVGFIVNISGDGAAMTRLYCSAGGIQVIGSATAGIYGSFFTISDLYMRGSGTGNGLDVLLCGFVSVSKVRSTGFEKGCFLKGVISSNFVEPRFDSNVINLEIVPDDDGIYPPNAISLATPWLASASKLGLRAVKPAELNISNGSIEGNGWDTVNWSENERGGVLIEQPGEGGHVAANILGGYIENNSGIADVLVLGATRRCTVNFIGITFNRLASDAGPTKHCVYLTGSTQRVIANITGNGFGELGGGFVPDATQRYIQADSDTGAYTVYDLGNDYMTDAARPDYRGVRALNSNSLPYACGYITAAGALENAIGNNISNVEKLSTGRYKITFAQGAIGRKVGLAFPPSGGRGSTFTSDTTSVTMDIVNSAGTAADSEFWFEAKVVGRW